MKKQLVPLLVSLSIVIILSCLLVVLFMEYKTSPKPEQQEAAPAKTTLLSIEDSSLNTVTLTNSTGSFTLVNQGDSFALSGLDNVKTKKLAVRSLVNAITHLSPLQEVYSPQSGENPTYSQYGLDNSSCIIQISQVSQEKTILALSQNPDESGSVYILCSGNVYLVSEADVAVFRQGQNYFVDTEVTPQQEAFDEGSIVLAGSVRPSPITVVVKPKIEEVSVHADSIPSSEGKQYTYFLTTPVEQNISDAAGSHLLSGVFSLQGDSVAAVYPTAEELASFGLGDPFSSVQGDFGDNSFSLHVSKPDNSGFVYLIKDGTPIVYYVSVDRLPWLTLQYEKLIDSNYTPSAVSDVSRFTVSSSKSVFDFVLTHSGGGTKAACNGAEMDIQIFTKLFTSISPLPTTGYTFAQPSLKPELIITIAYVKKDRAPDVISLIPDEPGQLLLTVNGKTTYTTDASVIPRLLENCRRAVEGKSPAHL